MILVTGASGQLGRAVVDHLLERVPAREVGVSVRDPEKVRDLEGRGVRVRRGDFEDPETLPGAFEGAAQVLLVSANTTGERALRLHRNAIDAAKEAGVRRLVYTSHMGARAASAFAPAVDHAATEAMLEASGLPFTSLRNGFYVESALHLMGPWRETGRIVVPEDGPVSWTARSDLAVAAARVLLEPGRFEGPTPPLTAARAFDFAAVAALASGVLGREIVRTTMSDAEYVDGLVEHGVPEPLAKMLLGAFVASRAGDFAAVDPTLESVLGRPPTELRPALQTSAAG